MIVECAVYEEGQRRPGELELQDACEAGQEPGAFVWIDLHDPTKAEFDAIREEFNLHPLAIEDALEAHERPKLERFEDMAFLVLKDVAYDDETEDLTFSEVMVFAGEGFAITVRHGPTTDLSEFRARLEEEPELLKRGPIGVVYAVLDKVVDDYEPVVDGLQQDIDEVEEGLFGEEGNGSTRRIYALGRELIEFSRATGPLVDPVRRLTSGDVPGGDAELQRYFRDVHDHIERVDSWVSAQRELLSNLLQANLTQVTIEQNRDMRKISAWVAIVAVPTAIAGIYGMNFQDMPELGWKLGYPAVMALIVIICAFLWMRFKRAGWL